MHLLFGNPPPISIAGRFVVACIGLTLAACLASRLSKRRPNVRGVLLLGLTVIVTLILSVGLGDHLGVLAFLGGAIGGSVLFVPGANGERRRRHAGWLIGACLLIGPILGIGLYGLTYLVEDLHPLDRMYYLKVFLLVGFVAGLLGALLVAVAVAAAGRRPRS